MKTMALTEETAPGATHSKILSVVCGVPSPVVGVDDEKAGIDSKSQKGDGRKGEDRPKT